MKGQRSYIGKMSVSGVGLFAKKEASHGNEEQLKLENEALVRGSIILDTPHNIIHLFLCRRRNLHGCWKPSIVASSVPWTSAWRYVVGVVCGVWLKMIDILCCRNAQRSSH